MDKLADIERKITQIEYLVADVRRTLQELTGPAERPVAALCQEPVCSIPDWP